MYEYIHIFFYYMFEFKIFSIHKSLQLKSFITMNLNPDKYI